MKDEGKREFSSIISVCLIVACQVVLTIETGGLDFSDVFNDNDNSDLPSGSGLKERVSGMIMKTEIHYKGKKQWM